MSMSNRPTLTARVMYEQAISQMREIEQELAALEKEVRARHEEHASLYAMAKAYEDGNPQIRDEEVTDDVVRAAANIRVDHLDQSEQF